MNAIDALQWRYATKRFDPTKKLSQEQLNLLLEAANLTATSYGLQPFQVILIENKELREQLREHANGQLQVTEASHLILFAINTSITEKEVDEYMERIMKTRNQQPADVALYEQRIKTTLTSRSPERLMQWAARQTYIALGTLMTVCAYEKIDSCPMEGFDQAKYDEILGLKERGLASVLMLPVGFRAEIDTHQKNKKVRKSMEELIIRY